MMKPKLYYQLDKFYSNHRNFVKSRIYKQMRGNDMEVSKIGQCDPVKTNKDVKTTLTTRAGGVASPDEAAYPCGLAAKYIFTDSYILYNNVSTQIGVKDTDISLHFDKSRYKNIDASK